MLDADPAAPFPPATAALREPDGLLAAGGDLSPQRLLNAYAHGIFPWYSQGQPILWWSPDPRMVFRTGGVHLSRRFRRTLRSLPWVATADTAFDAVVAACASIPRAGQRGTWITTDMRAAYGALHRLGHAHSVEVRDGAGPDGGELVGGLYGVAVGRMFFAESMFSARSGGSKAALAALAARLDGWGWPLLDAQVENPHLRSLGAEVWPRDRFLGEVARLTAKDAPAGAWTDRFGLMPMARLAA
ncbi:MAG: leucyl/phenylalanyl-tRNA--protein transferase [Luteimonas sp.]